MKYSKKTEYFNLLTNFNIMKRTLTMVLCMLFCTPSLLLAQHMTVTGKVTD